MNRLLMALVPLLLTVLAPATEAAPPGAAGVDSTWLSRVRADILRSEYRPAKREPTAHADAPVVYQAPNRANGFRTVFTDDGVRLVPRPAHKDEAPAWEWGLTLAGVGREGAMAEAACAEPCASDNRVEYRRGDLVEWYVNDERGLEQGFTLRQPPPHRTLSHGRPAALRLDMAVTGSLTPAPAGDGQSIDYLAPGGALAIRFAQLQVNDSTGRRLRASFEVDGACLSILIDDDAAVYPIVIDPLATSPAWTEESNQAAAEFGISVAPAGDVDGDGFNDVIVGAHFYDNGHTNEGRAFAYHGSAAGLSAAPAWTAESDQDFAELGIAVATAGDVNGDGYSDVIVGAYLFSDGQSNEGKAYVYLGSASGLSDEAAWTAEGDQDGAFFGGAVATAGDVNGDGYSDVIVGASFYDDGVKVDAGRAELYLSSPAGLSQDPDWASSGNTSSQAGALFGVSVAAAGDMDGDGFGEVIVGASGFDTSGGAFVDAGRAYIFRGTAAGLSAGASWAVEQFQDGAGYGRSVAPAGDVNGDGYSDVIVAAPNLDSPQTNEGRVVVHFGSPTGPFAMPGWFAESNQAGANFGASAAGAGDVNGDGYSDLIVGAPSYDSGQSNEGATFVWFGSPTMGTAPMGTPANADWSAESDQADALFGRCVATAGDVNGDGYSDVIVGALNYDNGQTNEGRAFLYGGSAAGPAAEPGWASGNAVNHSRLGTSVASAGDVNGDGYGDVIVGAPGFDAPDSYEGRVFVYHGSAAGPSMIPDWIAESNEPNAWLGVCVGSAGDVNGDGYGDVFATARYADNSLGGQGAVVLWLGSSKGLGPDGTPQNADWIAETDSLGISGFGDSAATAGDVNGDGSSDLIVGEPGYDDGVSPRGLARVWLGSPSGLGQSGTPANADWTAESDVGAFGTSVATAGDVNGDGYSDVIVGAPYYENGTPSEGAAFVWLGGSDGLGPSGTTLNADWFAESNLTDSYFGGSVATAGDVNGDGHSDVIVGAPDTHYGSAFEGVAFLWLGSSSGLGANGNTGNAHWYGEGNLDNAAFGHSVATAGDVNGDGYGDIIVGAPGYGGGNEGAAFLWLGSSTGLRSSGGADNADWLIEEPHGGLGTSAGTAGDVNGDGYSEVIAGAPHSNGEGGALVHYGNSGPGASVRPQQRREDDTAPIAHLGRAGSDTRFRIAQSGLAPLGRSMVKLEWEVKPLGTPMDGTGLQQGASWTDTGTAGAALSELVDGLSAESPYHWRVRTRYQVSSSPFQQHGRWMSTHGNSWNEADLRTGTPAVPGDVNGDGNVDVSDLVLVILNWGPCPGVPCVGDLNGDMMVDVSDLIAVILGWK